MKLILYNTELFLKGENTMSYLNSITDLQENSQDLFISPERREDETLSLYATFHSIISENTAEVKLAIEKLKMEQAEWQVVLDEALENEDWDFLEIYARVWPEMKPNKEKTQIKMDDLFLKWPRNWKEKYRKMQAVWDLVPGEKVMKDLWEKFLIPHLNDQSTNELTQVIIKLTGQKPNFDNQSIQQLARTIIELTGQKPPAEVVQNAYWDILQQYKYKSYSDSERKRFVILKEISGYAPDDDIGSAIADTGSLDFYEKSRQIFPFTFNSSQTQKFYAAYYSYHREITPSMVMAMPEKPNQELTQKMSADVINWYINNNIGENWLKKWQDWMSLSDIPPEITQDQADKVYNKNFGYRLLSEEGIKNLQEFRALSKKNPSLALGQKFIRDVGQELMCGYLKSEPAKEKIKLVSTFFEKPLDISAEECQALYTKAFQNNYYHQIIQIYNVFSKPPVISVEEARCFLLQLSPSVSTADQAKLEEIFSCSSSAPYTEKETSLIQKKAYDYLINLDAASFLLYQEKTNTVFSFDEVKEKILQGIEEKISFCLKNGSVDRKIFTDCFAITADLNIHFQDDTESVVRLYTAIIDQPVIDGELVLGLFEAANQTPIPAELAQKAYHKTLSPQYNCHITGRDNHSYLACTKNKTLLAVYQASGNTKPEITKEEAQEFYLCCLEDTYGKETTQVLAQISDIPPCYNADKIQNLYQKWVIEENFYYLTKIFEQTQIPFQPDAETKKIIQEKINEDIINASSSVHISKSYIIRDESKFDQFSFENSMTRLKKWIDFGNETPDFTQLQAQYARVLAEDPYWNYILPALQTSTGIAPQFSSDQIQKKAEKLLEQGKSYFLKRLPAYGQFSSAKEKIEQGFQSLLGRVVKNDDYSSRPYYADSWFDNIRDFSEVTKQYPAPDQLAEIFAHLLCDKNQIRNQYGKNKIVAAQKLMEESFSIACDPAMIQKIYFYVLQFGEDAQDLKSYFQVEPEFLPEMTTLLGDQCLEQDNYDRLYYLQKFFNGKQLSCSDALLQKKYQTLLSDEKFLLQSNESQFRFLLLFKLFGQKACCAEEMINQLYLKADCQLWAKLVPVLSGTPSIETIKQKYVQDLQLVGSRLANYDFIQSSLGEKFCRELRQEIVDQAAREANCQLLYKFQRGKSSIYDYCLPSAEAALAGYQYLATCDISCFKEKVEDYLRFYICNPDYLKEIYERHQVWITPSPEIIQLWYKKAFSCPDNSKTEDICNFLKNQTYCPNEEITQEAYAHCLCDNSKSTSKMLERMNIIFKISQFEPDFKKILPILEQQNKSRADVESRVQDYYFRYFFEIEVGKNTHLFNKQGFNFLGIPFHLSPKKTQLLYAQMLFSENVFAYKKYYEKLLQLSGIHPDPEMVQTRYQELLNQDFFDIKAFNNFRAVIQAAPSKNLLEQADEKITANFPSALSFIPYLDCAFFEEFFPKTYTKTVEVLSQKLASDIDLADYFLEYFHSLYEYDYAGEFLLKSITHYSVANKFQQMAEENEQVFGNYPWFEEAKTKATQVLAAGTGNQEDEDNGNDGNEQGDGDDSDCLDEHERRAARIPGFLENDPYLDHPWKKEQESRGLGRVLGGEISPQTLSFPLSQEALDGLVEIAIVVQEEHEKFLRQFQESSYVPPNDKNIIGTETQNLVKMKNLLKNVYEFTGRYLIQMAKGDEDQVSEIILQEQENIREVLRTGYQKYLDIYRIDIPLYDKLYAEFDEWQEKGRYPLEVYLGRDGVYAYFGRKGQKAGQIKKGEKSRQKSRLKYIIYPRHFRDVLDDETKIPYLTQQGLSLEADPIFYDTGYTGTIPEQIMAKLEFTSEEIEARIRLLSANQEHRRVRGISENARGEIIEKIEHNAKTERTAIGIMKDEETGAMKPVARPTSPAEQFCFAMIKQALVRHYFVREKLKGTA